jgi:hypothetical protein
MHYLTAAACTPCMTIVLSSHIIKFSVIETHWLFGAPMDAAAAEAERREHAIALDFSPDYTRGL